VAVVGGVLVAAASPDLLAAAVALGAALFATVLLRAEVDVVDVLIDEPAVTAAYEGDGVLVMDVLLSVGDGVASDDSVGCRLSAPPTAPANRAVALAARLAVGLPAPLHSPRLPRVLGPAAPPPGDPCTRA